MSDPTQNFIKLEEDQLKEQINTGQTIQKINTLLDVAEHLNGESWDGVRRLELLVQIENKLGNLIEKL
jgi:proline racemase